MAKQPQVSGEDALSNAYNNAEGGVISVFAYDYNLEVLMGNIPGHSMVEVIGHDDALTTAQTTIHPTGTTANIVQSTIHATPALIEIASTDVDDTSAGAGAKTVKVIGLDANGVAQEQTLSMNGRTEVPTTVLFSAVQELRVMTVGATGWNEGTIWCGTGTFTTGVPAVKLESMAIRANKSMTAYYTVPTGKTAYLRHFTATVGTLNKDVEFSLEHSTDGILWYTEYTFTIVGGTIEERIESFGAVLAGEHIRIEAQGSATTSVTAILDVELVDD